MIHETLTSESSPAAEEFRLKKEEKSSIELKILGTEHKFKNFDRFFSSNRSQTKTENLGSSFYRKPKLHTKFFHVSLTVLIVLKNYDL